MFAWLAHESRVEAGLGRTANAPPPAMRSIPHERIELLARFEPPPYTPVAGESTQLQETMQHYLKRDYAGAIPGLRHILEAKPDSVDAYFYLGICELLTNDPTSGIADLKNVIVAGNTPYLERARFYLAKGLLANNDLRGANLQLRIVVEMHGDFEKQAQALLAQIVPSH